MHDFFNTVIVIAIVLAVVYLRRAKHRAAADALILPAHSQVAHPAATGRERELEREVAELHQRIAVLERIVTDGRRGSDIAAQIEALRD